MANEAIIAMHEDFQRVPYEAFIRWHWQDRQGTPFPDVSVTRGAVAARIDHGRWLAECPDGCGNAVYASLTSDWYLCTICGNALNNGMAYEVTFPADRPAIELELLKRPRYRKAVSSRPWDNPTRNWMPGQTLSELRSENALNGVR